MQFETIFVLLFAFAVLVFLYARRHIIGTLQKENQELHKRNDKLTHIVDRQRMEINRLTDENTRELRARQLSSLVAKSVEAPRGQVSMMHMAQEQERAARRRYDQSSLPQHDATAQALQDVAIHGISVQRVEPDGSSTRVAPADLYMGSGGTFDGGGASGDYTPAPSSCDSSSSSSSSDSSSSCSSSDSSSSSSFD
jgi:uncharacterized protein YhbP (UPF0306 family)